MRAWITIVVFFGGIAALCWYGATGETGPMGWLNSWQSANTGSYSRGLSFVIVFLACAVLVLLTFGLRALVARRTGAPERASLASFTAPADARIAAMAAAMNDRTQWRWRMYLSIWLVGLVIIWAAVLGGFGWDYHRRASDAGSDYTPLRLERTTTVAHLDDGSHWALQGRLLWDRSVTQTTKDRATQTQTVYVPFASADWRPGDTIQFVVRLPKAEVGSLQHRAGGADGADGAVGAGAPLLVRVEGAIPTASRAVFQRSEQQAGGPAVVDHRQHAAPARLG